jgi:hypothetical protein
VCKLFSLSLKTFYLHSSLTRAKRDEKKSEFAAILNFNHENKWTTFNVQFSKKKKNYLHQCLQYWGE